MRNPQTISLSSPIYRHRRRQVLERMEPGSVMIVPTAAVSRRNRDVEYPFRADSDFHYLTGFEEPEAILVLKRMGRRSQTLFFCRERNPEVEQWEGERMGPDGARRRLGMSVAWSYAVWEEKWVEFLQGASRLYFDLGCHQPWEGALLQRLDQLQQRNRSGHDYPTIIERAATLLHPMRQVKSEEELVLMRQAAAISAEAHCRAMRQCRPGMSERQLESELLYEMGQQGVERVAYESIVAAGENGCTLHYIDKGAVLRAGELVLIDAGAEWGGYAADISRTFPVDGHFTSPQRQLYEVVLEAQYQALRQIRPGRRWNHFHRAAVRAITQGLIRLGLLQGELEGLIREEGYKRFYMHQTGHWLGRDVHDVGPYREGGKWIMLEPGMVLTVEPGLYIPNDEDIDPPWRGIGIRIEDDVVVTADGHELLTSGVPREIDEIEAMMAAEV